MAVSIKTILLLGVLAVVFSTSHAMQINKRQVNAAAARYGYSSESHGSMDNKFSCQGYYECMNKMKSKEHLLSSLKSEQATLLATMTSVNKKALEQERLLHKLMPQNKHMRHELEELNEELEECVEKNNEYIHAIAVLEAQIVKAMTIIHETINMCSELVGSWSLDRGDTNGVYYFSTGTSNWFEAQNECRLHGMDLISIDNEDELEYINNQIDTLGFLGSAEAWIGLNNFENNDDVYKWIGTGQSTIRDTSDGTVDTENWGTAEPTTTLGCGALAYEGTDLKWFTRDCSEDKLFICELPVICHHLFEIEFSISDLKI